MSWILVIVVAGGVGTIPFDTLAGCRDAERSLEISNKTRGMFGDSVRVPMVTDCVQQ